MKKMKTFMLCLVLCVSIMPKKSNAIVGLALGNIPLVIGSIAVAASPYYMIRETNTDANIAKAFLFVFLTGPIGLVLLDGEEEQGVEYKKLSEDQALELGINAQEREMYNFEIDQVNLVLNEVAIETEKLENPTPEQVKEIWEDYRFYLNPASFSALQKIGNQFIKERS